MCVHVGQHSRGLQRAFQRMLPWTVLAYSAASTALHVPLRCTPPRAIQPA